LLETLSIINKPKLRAMYLDEFSAFNYTIKTGLGET
jgi:hypothetical protein